MRALTASILLASSSLIHATTTPDDILTRDVCVIGGGSAGTYAAVNLKKANHSVVVIEQKGRLGGHAETYTDPDTNTPVNYGVISFALLPVVEDYLDYLGIPWKNATGGHGSQNIDFSTGKVVENDVEPVNVLQAFRRYADELRKYPFLPEGFELPSPVPEDLVLPFVEFVKKYDLGDAMDSMALMNQDMGDWVNYPTLYNLKYFSLDSVNGMVEGTGQLSPTSGNNSEIYGAAENKLAGDLLLQSTVASMDRTAEDGWIHLEADTPSGRRKIRTKNLVMAVPPTVDNLAFMDLDDAEKDLFARFSGTHFFTALVRAPGLPDTRLESQSPDTPYHYPVLPCVYTVTPTAVQDLAVVHYGSDDPKTEEEVKDAMREGVLNLKNAGYSVEKVDFLTFSDHSPYTLRVGAEDIRGGFYDELNELQGKKGTVWTGATFQAHDSTQIWTFTKALIETHFS